MIERLTKFREDGQVIHDGDSIEKVASLGPISRVIRVQWEHDGRILERSNPLGIFVKPLPQRDAFLCIEPLDEENRTSSLVVVNADDSIRFEVPSIMDIEGASRVVNFMYTYPGDGHNNTAFAVVVDVPSVEAQFKVFIDSYSGRILETMYVR